MSRILFSAALLHPHFARSVASCWRGTRQTGGDAAGPAITSVHSVDAVRRRSYRTDPVGEKNLLRGFCQSSLWTALPRESVFGSCSDRHLLARSYLAGRYNRCPGVRTGDLFLLPSTFGDRIYLHLRPDGAATIRAANATGDDSRDRRDTSRVPGIRRA